MKKMKKVLSLLLGGVVAMGSASAFPAEAKANFIDEPFVLPEGFENYEVFDDAGLFSALENSAHSEKHRYIPYRYDSGDHMLYMCFTTFQYNNFRIVATDKDAFLDIYEKYREELDFDVEPEFFVKETDGTYSGVFFDYCDENGYDITDPANVEDKSALIQEMCAEMYEAGCIQEATYTPYLATYAVGWESSIISVWNLGETGDSETETLQGILSQFREDGIVDYNEATECYNLGIDALQAPDLMYAIKEVYPDAKGSTGIFQMTNYQVSCDAVDILANLEQPETENIVCGDINLDGKISVLDAIMLSKANSQMIQLNETQTAAADCNGDGAVDSEDIHLLLCYLTEKVDVLPVTTS